MLVKRNYEPPKSFAQETCLWDEFIILLVGLGIGMFAGLYLPAAKYVFWSAIVLLVLWVALKIKRYRDYKEWLL